MKIFQSFLALLLLFSASHVLSEPYTIGGILPLTGDAASLGRAAQNGMRLAYESLPSDIKKDFQLIFEDDQQKPSIAVSAFHKLSSLNDVKAVVCWSSSTCKAMASQAESKRIALMAIGSDPSLSKNKKYVFNFWVTPESETLKIIPEIQKRGYKKIAIVSTIQEGVFACRTSFKEAARSKDISIVFDAEYTSDTRDFRSSISKLASSQPDAVLLLLMPGHAGIFARQLREGGVTSPIFGYETIEDQAEVKASNNALLGTWFVTATSGSSGFSEEYRQKFPHDSMVTANNGYDAVRLLVSGLSQKPQEISEFLSTVKNFSGASGVFSATGDNRFSLPAVLKVIKDDGSFQELYQ